MFKGGNKRRGQSQKKLIVVSESVQERSAGAKLLAWSQQINWDWGLIAYIIISLILLRSKNLTFGFHKFDLDKGIVSYSLLG